jgi:hypothetical protein
MFVSRHGQRRVGLTLGLLVAATIAACDTSPTQPSTELSRFEGTHTAIEGDTSAACISGWVVITGSWMCFDL